jgi:hypothetical protein
MDEVNLLPQESQPLTEEPGSTFLESQNSSPYLPVKDVTNFAFNTLPTIQDNLTAGSLLSLSASKHITRQLTFLNQIVGAASGYSASAIIDGAQRLLRTEASVKTVLMKWKKRESSVRGDFNRSLGLRFA